MRSGTGERAQTFISSAGLPADESDEQRKGDEGPALTVTRGPAARALGLSVNWEDPPPPRMWLLMPGAEWEQEGGAPVGSEAGLDG